MIDIALQASLRVRYNPDGSDLRKLQSNMLELLVWFDRFCKDNGLTYWITAGTLLGAVRHGGFIPWDDDVDVCMPKEDMGRFVKIFKEDGKYALQAYRNDPFYTSPYVKLRDKDTFFPELDGSDVNFKYRGVFIDIFCVEHCPYFVSKLALHFRWRLSNKAKRKDMSGVSRKLFSVQKSILFGAIGFANRCLRHYKKGPLRLGMGSGFLLEKRYEHDIFPLKPLVFEGYEFLAPCNPDAYLTNLYGDYATLPPEESIHPHSINLQSIQKK